MSETEIVSLETSPLIETSISIPVKKSVTKRPRKKKISVSTVQTTPQEEITLSSDGNASGTISPSVENISPVETGETVATVSISQVLGKKTVKFCPVVLSKGKRKGNPCSRKIVQAEEEFCKFHLGKSIDTNVCTVILTKGERKNQTCNRKVLEGSLTLCKIHKTLEDKRPSNPYMDKEANVEIIGDEICSLLCDLKISKLDVQTVENVRARVN